MSEWDFYGAGAAGSRIAGSICSNSPKFLETAVAATRVSSSPSSSQIVNCAVDVIATYRRHCDVVLLVANVMLGETSDLSLANFVRVAASDQVVFKQH